MMKEAFPQEPLDPRLISELNLLKDTPQRDPAAVEKNKDQFLFELENLSIPAEKSSALKQFFGALGINADDNNTNKEQKTMKSNKLRLALGIIAVLVVLVIVMFGGTTATVLASQNSIPGDTLYPIKTRLEQTRLSLARSTEARVELQLEFAEHRLDEIEALIKEGRFQNIQPAVTAFEEHILKALAELNVLSEENPAQAASLMVRLTESLARYAVALSDMASRVPEPLKTDLENTIINLGGGDYTNENYNDNINESYNDNINESYNDNINESYNDNFNESYDDDDDDDYNYNDSDDDDDDDDYNYNDSDDDDDDDDYNYNDSDDDDDDDDYNTNSNLNGDD
ncbi:MAG TPA: DUF5667 domain-containing protein [Bacteroidales bacterium]|nr:DUF5667 domain-containing protein [Bacteroidales bacterium]